VIPISRPALDEREQRALEAVLRSGQLVQGARVAEFEQAFAEFIGVRRAVAVNSGTAALHLALLAHGLGPGDEVVTTPFTFVASVQAILLAGARPVLVDVDASFNLDPAQVAGALTARTRAILPVHLYGQPADLGPLLDLAQRHGLALIEDAAQAHGAEYGGRRVGSFGTGCFSFYATKNLTTGEGGMLTTDDDRLADTARLLANHGMRVRYRHERLGYNYRLTDLAAALGLPQLAKLPAHNARRAEHARCYQARLGALPGLLTPTVGPNRTHVWHQYTLRVLPEFPLTRDELAARLAEAGIGSAIYYPIPVHRQEALRGVFDPAARFPLAERLANEVLSIPVHPLVTDQQREHIAATIERLARSRTR
jgi:dTDP-4-amino-4,6-dideoxygalactose transaminase